MPGLDSISLTTSSQADMYDTGRQSRMDQVSDQNYGRKSSKKKQQRNFFSTAEYKIISFEHGTERQ
jgi:hypothetical protein